jgi:hypothetical protein
VLQLLVFLTIGLVLLVIMGSLVVSALRGKAEGGGEALVDAQQALQSLQSELLAPDVTARVFARCDLDYVRSQGPKVEAFFLRERKRIALIWVGRVREQVVFLKRLHVGSARYYAQLSVKTELALALDFAMLGIGCRALQVAFFVAGPYAAPGMAKAVTESAARVCAVSKQSLAFLTDPGAGVFPPAASESRLGS